uniref:COX assembly mitochondrial protein n=1 Tax=Chlamydomonas leiostraca TaxID=1034604 RepID=A0A7S0RJJ9_9CHLO|mmetsp:Transcript_23687/g.60489  ORF Transcript_23687/g.60489 Transcript_23687/m.60489 type:complete len:101 (+) Transcript_23687:258-560(+)
MSHPQLLPEKHPKCGDIMRALLHCHDTAGWRRYYGACEDLNYRLSKCLVEEKKEFRAPRQAMFHEKWAARKAKDAARMAELEAEAAARKASEAAGAVEQA